MTNIWFEIYLEIDKIKTRLRGDIGCLNGDLWSRYTNLFPFKNSVKTNKDLNQRANQ